MARQERRDPCGIDHYPVTVSSECVERQERWDPCSSEISEEQLLTKPTKNPKPNKNVDHDQERGDPCHSEIPEWLQEFRQNLVDDRVPEHRDSHASSSHEPSSEPRRSVALGKQCLYSLPERPKLRDLPEDQNYKGPVQKTYWRSRTSCRKFLWFDYNRSQSSQWRLWISKQSSMCNRGGRLGHSMDPCRIFAKQKLLRKHKGACKSSWSRTGSLKSFTLTIPFFRGIIVRQHHTDRKQMGLLREQYAEWKKVRLQYCCNQVWMKIGGQIPWNATAYKHSRSLVWWENSMRKAFWRTIQRTNHSVWFTGWVIPYLCERPVENPSIWKESITWIVPRIRSVRGRNLEVWHTGCRHWGVGNDGHIWNLLEKTYCKRSDISQRKWRIYFSNRRWTNQTSWRRSRPENIHLDTGSSNSRRRPKRCSWRIRRVSSTTSRLISGCRWSDKWLLVHVTKLHIPPSRWTQSQTLLAKRRIIPYSIEIHWRLQNDTTKLDVMQESRIDDYWNIDGSRDLCDSWTGFTQFTLWDEKPPNGKMWSGERLTKRQATSRPDHLWPELQTKLGRNAKLREKQKWSIEKPKLDNARRLRGIYFIDPEDNGVQRNH